MVKINGLKGNMKTKKHVYLKLTEEPDKMAKIIESLILYDLK